MISVLLLAVAILFIAYILYINKPDSSFVPNDEFVRDTSVKDKAEVYLFYATWCPHSIDALKTWHELTEIYKTNDKYNLKFIKVDVDEDPTFADSFNIDSYPSVVLVYKNNHYTYDALLEAKTFKTFLSTFIK
jgi:thiol-disulfide isomerase/thioredoxin